MRGPWEMPKKKQEEARDVAYTRTDANKETGKEEGKKRTAREQENHQRPRRQKKKEHSFVAKKFR